MDFLSVWQKLKSICHVKVVRDAKIESKVILIEFRTAGKYLLQKERLQLS